jgi:hypothetical protein
MFDSYFAVRRAIIATTALCLALLAITPSALAREMGPRDGWTKLGGHPATGTVTDGWLHSVVSERPQSTGPVTDGWLHSVVTERPQSTGPVTDGWLHSIVSERSQSTGSVTDGWLHSVSGEQANALVTDGWLNSTIGEQARDTAPVTPEWIRTRAAEHARVDGPVVSDLEPDVTPGTEIIEGIFIAGMLLILSAGTAAIIVITRRSTRVAV